MTTEIAYQILGLENNASAEEVKEAYARLSKEYHPEENPEEFQHIHEAYTTLTRRGRRANRAMLVEESPIVQREPKEARESDLVFHKIDNYVEEPEQEDNVSHEYDFEKSVRAARQQEELEKKEQYDFDASIQQAQSEEIRRIHQMFFQLTEELDMLLTPPNCHQLKKFKAFFGCKEYGPVIYSHKFIGYLAECLEEVQLKNEIYSYIIGVYNLNGFKYEKLVPEAKRLYQAIDRKYSVKKDVVEARKIGIFGGVAGGLIYPLTNYGPQILKFLHRAGVDEFIVWIGLAILLAVIGIIVFVNRKNIPKKQQKEFKKAIILSSILLIIVVGFVLLCCKLAF